MSKLQREVPLKLMHARSAMEAKIEADPSLASKREMLRKFSRLYVNHEGIQFALSTVKANLERRFDKDKSCIFLTGHPGVGKSLVIEKIVQSYPRKDEDDGDLYPVINCLLPAQVTIKSLCHAMLEQYGRSGGMDRWTQVELTRHIIKLAQECQTRLIIFDEFQQLVQKRRVVRDVADWVRNVNTQLGITMLMVGTPLTNIVIEAEEQISRRSVVLSLKEIEWESADGSKPFQEMLVRIVKAMDDPMLKPLVTEDYSKRIYVATAGIMDRVKKLIKEALVFAHTLNESEIHLQHLAWAFEYAVSHEAKKYLRLGDDDDQNPFLYEVNGLEGLINLVKAWLKNRAALELPRMAG